MLAALSPIQIKGRNGLITGLLPDPVFNVSEWADEHRRLTESASAEPGRWRTARTPYLREIMDSLSAADPCDEVVFIKGSQVGGTEAGINWLGYLIDYAPGPALVVQPTVDIGKRFSRQRISPLVNATPRIKEKVKDPRSRDSGNTVLSKEFPGGVMMITGANSAAGLRSMPIRYLMLDEVDAYPEDVDGEGEPVELATVRTRTFTRRKIFKCSSPTFAGRSRIEAAYNRSDMRKYYVPCPHCEAKQVLVWRNVKWDKGKPETASYVCEHCGALIEEHEKTRMLERGEWIAENPGASGGKVKGYHISALYSPVGWFSWADAADQWEAANKNQEKLRVFVNTVLGETWQEKGDAPDWRRLFDRRESYKINTIPSDKVRFLTAGVDIQKDRIEVEVVGWCEGKESYSIDYRVFMGNYEDKGPNGPWVELDRMLTETWQHPSGAELPLVRVAVDSSAYTQEVRDWCRKHPLSKVMAIKGSDTAGSLISHPKAVDVTVDGRTIKRGLKEWRAGVSIGKTELYGFLNLEKPTDEETPYPAGYCHFPEYEPEYFEQITAERITVRLVKGYRKYQWEKTRERNEALDCRIYARVAAAGYGIDRFTAERWQELAEAVKIAEADTTGDKVVQEKHGVQFKKGSFLRRD